MGFNSMTANTSSCLINSINSYKRTIAPEYMKRITVTTNANDTKNTVEATKYLLKFATLELKFLSLFSLEVKLKQSK